MGLWVCPDALDRLQDKVESLGIKSGIPTDAIVGYGLRGQGKDRPFLRARTEADKDAFEAALAASPNSPLASWLKGRDAEILAL